MYSLLYSCRHPVAAQFCPYPQQQGSMLRWRNESQPPLPINITDITDTLNCEQWIEALTYDITFANEDTGTVKKTTQHLTAWSADDEGCNVIFGTVPYAKLFVNVDFCYVDATFDVVPNIQGAYQLLTLLVHERGEVCENNCNSV